MGRWLLKAAGLGVLAAVALVVALFGLHAIAQDRSADAFAITSPKGIDEEAFVPIGGVDQWVTIRGQDRDNPVILIVGGVGADGPGAVLSPFIGAFQPWEREFTVVNWDQRGAGKTFARAGEKLGSDLSIDLLTRDGLALTDYLRARLHKPKIVVLGVGFGTTVAVKMALARPELYAAYVAAGQIANPRKDRERSGYDRLLRLATARGDTASLADLKMSGPSPWRPPRDPAKVAAFVRAAVRYRAPVPPHPEQDVVTAPHWSIGDALAIQAGMKMSEARIGHDWGENFDYSTLGPDFLIPVFVIQGDGDTDAPVELSRAWFDRIHAPEKGFIVIPGAGDHALQTHSHAFLETLDARVRPIAIYSRRSVAIPGPGAS